MYLIENYIPISPSNEKIDQFNNNYIFDTYHFGENALFPLSHSSYFIRLIKYL